MKDQILTYRQMCDNEGIQTLQRGMNFQLGGDYSVILMSQRKNAPYSDKIYDDGVTIEYEGHDVAKTERDINPKKLDQPIVTKSGTLTQNGKFVNAVEDHRKGLRDSEIVRVYEKILPGIWSEKGFFELIDYKNKVSNLRKVYRFILREIDFENDNKHFNRNILKPRSRVIPTNIKKEVWERDGGKCVICGKTDELHFDHDLPYSKGGTSIKADNVKILCARHNLEKSDKIQ